MYSAVELSKYIVTKCTQENCPISNLRLQKILFYIQREYLKRGLPAFPDPIEAWQFGPVVPNVYYFFCGYGAMPVDMIFPSCKIDPSDAEIIDTIVESKRTLYPWDMVAETHKSDGAYDQTYRNGEGNHCVIKPELIVKYG